MREREEVFHARREKSFNEISQQTRTDWMRVPRTLCVYRLGPLFTVAFAIQFGTLRLNAISTWRRQKQ